MPRTSRDEPWELRPIFVERSDYSVRGPGVIDDGMVDIDFDHVEFYDWSRAESLPYDLAAIRHEADILGFVRRWGLLGTTSDEPDESNPEPTEDWWDAARNINFLLYLHALVDKYERGTLTSARDVAEFWAGIYTGSVFGNDGSDTTLWKWLTEPTEREQKTSEAIGSLLNGDLDVMVEDIRTEILEEELWEIERQPVKLSVRRIDSLAEELGIDEHEMPPGNYALTVRCDNLLARAYVQLALEVTRGVPAEICPEDGRVFAVRDPRQRYCSPQCAGRARSRRFAQKKRR
jgi:hypothetical protein